MITPNPVNWSFVLLKQNPFPTVPPQRTEDAVWAGFPKLLAQFNDLFLASLTGSNTQVVLNRGAWGSGKTHAAVFFGMKNRLANNVQGEQVSDALILYVRTPKEPEKADEILYKDIIEAVQFKRMRQMVRNLIKLNGEGEALSILQNAAHSEALGRAIWLLGFDSTQNLKGSLKQLSLFNEEHENVEWRRILEACFFSEATKGDLKQLGISRGISTSQDRFRVLSALFQCIGGFSPVNEISAHQRIILWVDEMEDLLSFTRRYHRPFTQGLRDLIDFVPHYFTLIMNFTLSAPEDLEDINAILGGALMDRIDHQIYFQEPTQDEALEYTKELLSIYRTEAPQNYQKSDSYPFDDAALKNIIANLPVCTPRDINQSLSAIITKALQDGVISEPGHGIIDSDYVSKFDEARLANGG